MAERGSFKRGGLLEHKIDPEILDLLPDGPETDLTRWMHDQGIRLAPRRAEAALLRRVEEVADGVIAALFGPADEAMERLRASARKPRMRDTPAGQVRDFDPETGEALFEAGPGGEPVLDWRLVDGMDVETAIMDLQRVIDRSADEVGKLHAKAVFAWHAKEDEYWEGYRSALGTIKDGQAVATRESRDSRYHFFAMWAIWTRADRKLESVRQAKRDLEFMRNRLIKEVEQVPGPFRKGW